LVAQARSRIEADLRLSTTYEVPSSPNPLHWHFDRIVASDPGIGPLSDCLVTSWTLPLDGDWMSQTWSLL
jgi:hypothetical protein